MRCVSKKPVVRDGFTLLELILVMIILCTVLGIAAPLLRGFFASRKLNDVAEQMLILARYARLQAIYEARYYRLNFDTVDREYWLTALKEGEYERLYNNFGGRYPIPEDVKLTFEDVPEDIGLYYFEFDPQGYTKVCSLDLEDKHDNHLALVCFSPNENFELLEMQNDHYRY